MAEDHLSEFKVPFNKKSSGLSALSKLNVNVNEVAKPQAAAKPVQNISPLKNINFELAEIYFPMFVIQTKYDIFPLRNRSFGANYVA